MARTGFFRANPTVAKNAVRSRWRGTFSRTGTIDPKQLPPTVTPRVRREVLGAEHVARAQARTTQLDADFQRFITETAWGSVWARPDLYRRTRSLVTIAILAALGRTE